MKEIKTIGVLTSGGDAPGMNAAIRAVARGAMGYGMKVMGIRRGYHGLLRGEIEELNSRSVSDILQRGGTFLQTARSKSFATEEGIKKAVEVARIFGIDALVVIGGDGSYKGARALANSGLPTIGIPGTIDNDIGCTDYTIGYDTALNTAMQAIDKIRDTASSHERCSVVEVMGRNAGYIPVNLAVANGAEAVIIPEAPYDLDEIKKTIIEGRNRGKSHYIVVVSEGVGETFELCKTIEEATGVETRATVLGYVQRGGSPTLIDRVTATKMGSYAADLLAQGTVNRIIAQRDSKIIDIEINEAIEMTKKIEPEMLDLVKKMSI
ncbi:MAG: 6-phosphofructokinase [Clostridia bacterium]|nr:6-phosphofructokinase [Oscillospiraceae bacterium]MDY5627305.1 6-phosphofructokinase [Clostridia bacterium]